MPWSTSDRRSRLPTNWPKLRAQVRKAAGGQCEWITTDGRCPADGTDCDHIVRGDNHALQNLQWLCRHHHDLKSRAEAQAAKPSRRRTHEANPGLQ